MTLIAIYRYTLLYIYTIYTLILSSHMTVIVYVPYLNVYIYLNIYTESIILLAYMEFFLSFSNCLNCFTILDTYITIRFQLTLDSSICFTV